MTYMEEGRGITMNTRTVTRTPAEPAQREREIRRESLKGLLPECSYDNPL